MYVCTHGGAKLAWPVERAETVSKTIRKYTENIWNAPNVLTMLRLALIPVFVALFAAGHDKLALLTFVIASLTDLLDGYLARKHHQITAFGKLMDPLADKLMVMAALVCFTYRGIVHPAVSIIILAREFLVTGLRMLATSSGRVIAADIWGKLKTVSQDVGIVVILAWQALEHASFAPVLKTASTVCIWVMTVLTVVSAVNYCARNIDVFKETK